MSDPVTNVEIEDVLSSIRRLVSEGDKAKRAEPRSVPDKPAPPEKLVLTPALRVAVSPDDSSKVKEDTAEAPVDDVVFAPTEAEDAAQEPEGWVDDTPMAFVPAETVPDDVAEEIHPDDVPFDRAKLEEASIKFERANLEATIAELEAAVTDQPDEWEPDGSETDISPTWAAAGFPSDQPVEDAEEIIAVDDAVEPEVADLGVAEDDTSVIMPPLSFHHTEDEADEDHGDDMRGGETSPEDEELAAYLADDTVIDEAMLRQLVIEIVRSELQGKLGERITRNVRKLVRREIHRVLTSQNLD